MTPIVGDLISVVCRHHGTHRNLRVQGCHEPGPPADAWCVAAAPGIEVSIATRPDPRHATLEVHETNWALRVLAICYAIARAVVAEQERIAWIKADALVARLERERYEQEEGAA
jgi:hypothetical protein